MSDQITLTADVIIQWADGSIVLARRRNDPHKHEWALPGGMMDGVYSAPGRDPRGRYISVAYLAYPVSGILESGSDAEDIRLTKDPLTEALAFDHHQIVSDYLHMVNPAAPEGQ
jgi:8-oxo-dGTP diphosphatase